jgi:hypothetical protein
MLPMLFEGALFQDAAGLIRRNSVGLSNACKNMDIPDVLSKFEVGIGQTKSVNTSSLIGSDIPESTSWIIYEIVFDNASILVMYGRVSAT